MKLAKGEEGGLQGSEIEFGFEGKMVEVSGFAQPFKFDIGVECSKQVVGL